MNPWDPQPGEGPRPHEAFIAYRDMPTSTRNLRAVAQQLDKSVGLISRWSATHSWVERASAWDRHLRELADADAADAHTREMARLARQRARRASQLLEFGGAVMGASLRAYAPYVDPDGPVLPLIEAAKAATAATAAIRGAAVILGDPTRVEVSGPAGAPIPVAATVARDPAEDARWLVDFHRSQAEQGDVDPADVEAMARVLGVPPRG